MNTKTTLFQLEERAAIESRFEDDRLYNTLAGTCRRIMNYHEQNLHNESIIPHFKLHPTELFYQVCFVIDLLRGLPLSQQLEYCNNEAWEELEDYFCGEKCINGTPEDINRCICCILRATAELMIRSGKCHLVRPAAALLRQVASHLKHNMDFYLEKEFKKSFHYWEDKELEAVIGSYWDSPKIYSQDMESIITQTRNRISLLAETKEGGANQTPKSLHKPSIRIAKRKKTSAIVVLNAMYQAGWFVDKEGNPLTSRDKAINEILKNAFGEEKDTAISQTLKPSHCTNSNKNQKLISDLLDTDNLKKVIEEIQADLVNKG